MLISHDALVRGHTQAGETAEIAGVGPVPVAVINELMNDAFLAAVVTDGRDVFTVAHMGRNPTAYQRTALLVRDRMTCVVAGCTEQRNLEIDHVKEWSKTRRTFVRDLALLCHFHHRRKTVDGYVLRRDESGDWEWLAPARPPP